MRPSATVATPIVWWGARRRSVGEPGLKIAKPSRSSCSGRCEWPKTTASAPGKRRRMRCQPAVGRAGVVDHRDLCTGRLDGAHERQPRL